MKWTIVCKNETKKAKSITKRVHELYIWNKFNDLSAGLIRTVTHIVDVTLDIGPYGWRRHSEKTKFNGNREQVLASIEVQQTGKKVELGSMYVQIHLQIKAIRGFVCQECSADWGHE